MPLSTAHMEETFKCREKGIKRLLFNILNLNIQYETNEKSIINVINKLLSTAKDRQEGLEYLSLIITNCSSSVIAENALNWINHCIVKFPDDILRELKLRLIGKIIEISHNESDFNKRFVSDYISKVLDNCLTTSHINPYECKTALETISTAMKYYPTWFGLHKQKMEHYILIFIDTEDAELVQAAALAFHYLHQVGGAGTNGANHKLNFTENFHKLCRTAHKLFDNFFENERELFHVETSDDDTYKFQDDPTQTTEILLHVNARRIHNIFKFIETMIKTRYPVAKETKPKELLEVISRGTSIHKCISGDSVESLETYQFSLLLLEIQCATLKLLRLFIVWYQTIGLPFSYSVSKVIVDSIERSHNCDCFKSNSLYQESAYRALSEWISVSKSSLHPHFQSHLLECILKDITPLKTQVTLTISEAIPGKKSQKAKRKAMTNRIISSGSQLSSKESATSFERSSERTTCEFALTALRCLLESTRLNVKSDLLKDLYKSIFDSIINLQSAKPEHPYSDPHCRAKLYEVLVAIYHQNTLSVIPPLHTSLDILNRGANDKNCFVARICHKGLRMLESFCQPVCPSLYLGLEKEENEETEMPRDVREVEEINVDEGEEDTVDYDASTDEFPNDSHDGSFGTSYHVKYTDTDNSTNDDGLSDKGTNNEQVEVEELDFDALQSNKENENEMQISELPVVTAPSEDGNEILEGHNTREEVKSIQEDEIDLLSDKNTQGEEVADNDLIKGETETSTNNVAAESDTSYKALEVENQHQNKPSSTSQNEEDCRSYLGEPSHKKAKIVVEEDMDDVFVENTKEKGLVENLEVADDKNKQLGKEVSESNQNYSTVAEKDLHDVSAGGTVEKEGDPDASYLEEDSFVDEVKNYY